MLDEELKQRISLLVDNRLDMTAAMKLAKGIESDPDCAAKYSRYLLVGESIRSPSGVVHDSAFVDRIHQALAKEPTLLAPMRKRAAKDRLVTVALAATLAGVAVLVGESIMRQSSLAIPGAVQQGQLAESSQGSMQKYLDNHNGTAYLAANGGLLPYLRVVSQGSQER